MDLPALIKQFAEFQAQIHGPNPRLQPSKPRVYGTILHPNGRPGVGLVVIANDCDIRAVEPLGRATSNEKGTYAISYKLDTNSSEQKKSVNLLMQVFRGNQLLFQSPMNQLRFNASTECQIDITLAEGDTNVEYEYSRLDRVIKPVVGDLAINELQENDQIQDITFLSGKLGEEVTKLRYYSLARRLSSAFEIPPEFFYAIFAENSLLGIRVTDKTYTYRFNISLDGDILALFYDVVLLPPNEIASAIDRAFSNELIPQISKDVLQMILTTLKLHESNARRHSSQNASRPLSALIVDGLEHGKASDAKDKVTFDFMGDIDFILGQARQSLELDAAQGESALAKLTHEEWIRIIEDSEEKTQGSSTRSESVQLRASQMLGYMEERHPTAAFVANMERDPSFLPETRRALLTTFSKPGFSLLATSMTRHFSSNTGTEFADRQPGKLQSQQNARQVAAAIQRVFKLTPTYQRTKALIDSGISSSATIHAWGKEGFIQHFTEQGIFQKAEAESIFQRATDIHLASCFMAGEIQAITAATRVQALSKRLEPRLVDSVFQDYPNMKSLFQLGDFCACEDCRTVHSAAAYVVDTLQFLKNRRVMDKTTSASKNAKDVLFSRRPDLGDMDLSCSNTNITLPYVDLVCELLEEAVSPDPGITFNGVISTGMIQRLLLENLNEAGLPFTPTAIISDPYNSLHERIVRDQTVVCKLTPENQPQSRWTVRRLRQTYGSAEEVAAVPQYVNSAAYDVLSSSVYAFGLPFDLAHEETRAYFAQFGIPRGDLMRALKNESGPSDFAIVAEDLGLSEMESILITSPDVDSQAKYWNSGSEPAATFMKNVLTFVDRAVITYTDLQTLLSLQWLNPRGTMSINHLDDSCDLDKKEIAGLDDASLDRLHRFIRLWKRTRTPSEVLDRAICATKLGNNSLANDILLHIRDMILISAQLNLSLAEVCTFYSTIPDLLYSRIFLNPAANGKMEAAFELSNMLANEDIPVKLLDYASYVALCLGTSEPVIQLIIGSLGGSSVILSLANLAAVYSLLIIAKALNKSVEDLLTIKAISEIDLLLSPSSTLAFLAAVKKIQGAHLSPSNLQFILTNISNDATIQDLSLDAVLEVLQTLQAAYQRIVLSYTSEFNELASPTENRQALMDVLSKIEVIDASSLNWFSKTLSGIFKNINDPSQITQELNAKLSFLDAASLTAITAAFVQALAPAASDSDKNQFIQTLIDALSAWLTKQDKIQVLNLELQTYFQLSREVVTEVLQHARLRQPASANNMLLADILTDDALTSRDLPLPSINAVQFKTQVWAIRLLSVMARYFPSLGLSAEKIGWLLENSPIFDWLKLDDLAYGLDSTDKTPEDKISPISYTTWASFQDLLGILKSYVSIQNPADPKQPFTVFGLFELTKGSTTMHTFVNYLAKLTGLESRTLDALSGHFGFTLNAEPTPFWRPESYLGLQMAATILRKLGLDLRTALSLCKHKLSVAEGLVMRQALKARYADADWLEVLKNVQDPIRRKKRDALIAYLLAVSPTIHTSADLYRYYLIDVEMGACMSTSRIVQAHATIQLFVQRCLMGLEPQIVADLVHDNHWSQWKWMANYRVWEANRKVFLWPENWIEPNLRMDKSEIFQKFENELSEISLSDDAVESCLQSYLEDLEDIAQLDVMACHYDTQALTMHVFARTRGGDPHVYYHRQFIQEREWTPWAQVDLDINGPQSVAFIRNGCLCLAWPVFTEESDPSQMEDPVKIPSLQEVESGKRSDRLRRRWKIQLAVSEWINESWKAKKVSEGALYHPSSFSCSANSPLPSKELFTFYNWKSGSEQAISGIVANLFIGSFKFTGITHDPEPVIDVTYRPITNNPVVSDTNHENGRFIRRLGEFTQLTFTLTNSNPYTIFMSGVREFKVTDALQTSSFDLAERQVLHSRHWGHHMPFFYRDFSCSLMMSPGFYRTSTVNEVEVHGKVTFTDVMIWIHEYIAIHDKYHGNLQQVQQDPDYWRLIEVSSMWFRDFDRGVKLRNFDHPLISFLRNTINRGGVTGLMKRSTQLQLSRNFEAAYDINLRTVRRPYPVEDLDFTNDGAYSGYNWELFFHVPFEIAMRLNQDQNFRSAQRWFHYIFNPVGTMDSSADPAPQKYWITKPFFLTATTDYISSRIEMILGMVAADLNGDLATDLKFAISQWRANPFQPHVIAKTRPVAYQLAIVIKYIKNLIDWGDALFREYTRESITQATQYYMLADKLLGPKPRNVPPVKKPAIETYNQLERRIDLFGNALVDLENFVPSLGQPRSGETPPSPITGLYFCVDQNEELLGYWDLVADRLFKIRHCQNINGIAVPLALFSPPVDPGAMVRAVARGADITSYLAGRNAPLPFYRFTIAVQKAVGLAQLAGSFGSSFLEALEKKDTEAMARLRSTQQNSLAGAVRHTKLKALEEGKGAVTSLALAKNAIQGRKVYYSTREYMNTWEISATSLLSASLGIIAATASGYMLAGGLKLIPQFLAGAAGFGGSPTVSATAGGDQVGGAADAAVKTLEAIAASLDKSAELVGMQGDFHRRWDEWAFSREQANAELTKCDQDIVNAELHNAMLQADIDQHDLEVTQSRNMDAFMRSKFTNQELYQWMISATSKMYFDAYQLAFDVARQAERALQLELGTDRKFLTFGWDSLRRGLLAADELVFSLRTMEITHDRKNSRDYELTKHIRLSQLDAEALCRLKVTGNCTFQVSEAAFDLDHPGHYMRRHKSVSLSILFPGVAEPYASVNCKLSLLSNRYRAVKTLRQGAQNEQQQYAEDRGGDGRFVYDVGSVQSIATSSGQDDAGVFELDFDDERYLPFEYTGAIATWRIELPPPSFQPFDYCSITDAILHLRYTARDGGTALRNVVIKALKDELSDMVLHLGRRGLYHAYILREQFSESWSTLQSTGSATLTLEARHLPYFVQQHEPRITEVKWYATAIKKTATGSQQQALSPPPPPPPPPPASVIIVNVDDVDVTLDQESESETLNGLLFSGTGKGNLVQLGKPFSVKMPVEDAAALRDLVLVTKIGIGTGQS